MLWWTRRFWITPVVFIFVGILLIGLGFVTVPNGQTFLMYLGGFFIFCALLIVAFFVLVNRTEDNFEKNAIRGEAIILSREQTGIYLNNQPQVRFQLTVSLPGEEPYQIEHKEVVKLLDLGSISVGATIQVLVDPRNKKKMKIV